MRLVLTNVALKSLLEVPLLLAVVVLLLSAEHHLLLLMELLLTAATLVVALVGSWKGNLELGYIRLTKTAAKMNFSDRNAKRY